MRARLVALVSLLLIGVFFVYLYLFRRQHEENPALGAITYLHRWGNPYELRADSNRDGEVDFRALVSGENEFSPHTPVILQFWEDRDFDRVYELHAIYDKGEITLLEIDDDKDGIYDRILTGTEAGVFYQGLANEYRDALVEKMR